MNKTIGHVILSIISTLKNCLFDTFKLTRNVIKSKFVYSGQGIAIDAAGS